MKDIKFTGKTQQVAFKSVVGFAKPLNKGSQAVTWKLAAQKAKYANMAYLAAKEAKAGQ